MDICHNGLWRTPARLILVAGAIATAFFLLFCLALTSIWGIGIALGLSWDLWQMMEGAASAGVLAVSVAGGLVVLYELSQASEARNLSGFSDAFRTLSTPEQIAARRWLYNLPDDPQAARDVINESPENSEQYKRVMNVLDYVGFLVQQEWLEAEKVVGWLSPFVVKTWNKVGPVVELEASIREEPDYYMAVRELARRCMEYRERRYGHTHTKWLRDAL